MTARLVDVRDPAWADLVGSVPHDVYHLPAYAAVSAELEGGVPRAALVEDGERWMLLPLVVRDLDGGTTDATSPYGYPGPVGTDMQDEAFVTAAFAEAGAALREAGAISLFVRFHPLLNATLPRGSGTIVDHGATVAIDLERTPKEMWHETRENHRRDIRRAKRDGFAVGLETDDAAWATFHDLYQDTMRRLDASPFYRFDQDHFQALRTALGDRLWLAMVRVQGEPVAAGLFFREAGIVQYHLSGTDPRYRGHQPTKLMIHAVAEWAKGLGDRRFHLGGGVGSADDALLHFKAGFSSLRYRFLTLRAVLDPAEYERRVAAGATGTGSDDGSDYFPAYRRR